MAASRDVSIGHIVRDLLRREVNRYANAKTSNRTDERLVAALQALLARDLAEATSWADLDSRLARHGFRMKPAGGGLTLNKRPCGTRICKASELGFAYRTFVERFQAGMPGHPHGGLDVVPLPAEPGFDVIERYN